MNRAGLAGGMMRGFTGLICSSTIAVGLLSLAAPSARADFIQFGQSGNYAVLGIGGTMSITSDFEVYQSATVVNGNVGVGPYSVFSHGFDGTINGRLDYDTTITTPPTVTGAITGGVHQMSMGTASPPTGIIGDAILANTYFAGLGPTTNWNINGGTNLTGQVATLNEDDVINGGHGLNIVRVTGDVTLKKTLTFNGFADSQFVLQLTAADAASAKTLTLSGMDVLLAGGVTGDNIVWDLSGGGGQVVISSDSNVYGSFLAPYRTFTGDQMNLLLGRVIAGGSPNPVGGDNNFLSIHSSSNINSPGTPTPVPLPSTAMAGLALMGTLALAGGVRKLRSPDPAN